MAASEFLKIDSRIQKTKALNSWSYLFENNEVRRFVKFMISSASSTHVGDLSGPRDVWQDSEYVSYKFNQRSYTLILSRLLQVQPTFLHY